MSKRDVIVVPELEKIMVEYDTGAWKEKEMAILVRYYGRVPIAALAKELNRTERAVYHKARKLGLRSGHPSHPESRT